MPAGRRRSLALRSLHVLGKLKHGARASYCAAAVKACCGGGALQLMSLSGAYSYEELDPRK
eukprot:21561-Heterococcus_DN1.PRE.2